MARLAPLGGLVFTKIEGDTHRYNMHKNHWIDELRKDYYQALLHESHIALWRFKCRENEAFADNNWAAAAIAADYIDAEKDLYWRIKERLNNG